MRNVLPEGTPIFQLSGATGRGVDDLLFKAFEFVEAERALRKNEALVVETLEEGETAEPVEQPAAVDAWSPI